MRASTAKTCTSAITLNKTTPTSTQNFYSLVASTSNWSDPDFTPSSDALYWGNLGEDQTGTAFKETYITWKKAKDIYPHAKLWGTDG